MYVLKLSCSSGKHYIYLSSTFTTGTTTDSYTISKLFSNYLNQ